MDQELSSENAAISTPEQAVKFVEVLIGEMERWRVQCDVIYPQSRQVQATYQRRALWTFLSKQGQVLGALNAFAAVGLLSDNAFKDLHQRALRALQPTLISSI